MPYEPHYPEPAPSEQPHEAQRLSKALHDPRESASVLPPRPVPVVPSDSLSPIALAVLTPHDVLVLIPSLIDSESLVPQDSLASRLPDPVRGANAATPVLLWPRPRLRPSVSLRDTEAAPESAGATPASDAVVSGTNTRPIPIPSSIIGPNTPDQ